VYIDEVPDPPDAITSNTGWDTIQYQSYLKDVIGTLKAAGIRVSIFLNADVSKVEAAKTAGADRIELYTGPYAEEYEKSRTQAQNFQLFNDYKNTAKAATAIGLDLNAGHDLSLDNLRFFKLHIPQLKEVSIGHALVCDAIYLGLENTIQLYKRELID
jgi:pyridoxine 5-phosphate synthase